MTPKTKTRIAILPLVFVLAACDESTATGAGRDIAQAQSPVFAQLNNANNTEQIARGEKVYRDNCATCHGVHAQGAFNWKNVGPDGKYPAPPLNGTGHAWHHPMKALRHVIKNGSPGGQGSMPPWKDKLTGQEIDEVILWFQSKWSPKIFQAWLERDRNAGFQRM